MLEQNLGVISHNKMIIMFSDVGCDSQGLRKQATVAATRHSPAACFRMNFLKFFVEEKCILMLIICISKCQSPLQRQFPEEISTPQGLKIYFSSKIITKGCEWFSKWVKLQFKIQLHLNYIYYKYIWLNIPFLLFTNK